MASNVKKCKYNGKEVMWDSLSYKCPLCGEYIVIKKQRPENGCIKVRFFKCTVCEFDSRNLER